MPHVYPSAIGTHRALNPVRLEPPVYMANGPMYVVYYPCPCGLEQCVQPVLVNGHHVRSMQAAQHVGIIHIPPPIANDVIPHVLNQHVVPPNLLRNQLSHNEFVDEFVVEQEGPRLEYPMYPEVQPRQYRRRNRARRRRNIKENVSLDRDNDCDVDR